MLEQARELAARIHSTWAGGPTAEVWVEELLPLDEGTAGTTLVRLRRELERAPSVAKFLDRYRGLSTRSATARVECVMCDGEGWVTSSESPVRSMVRDDDGNLVAAEGEKFEHRYSYVTPCTCEAGRRMVDVHRAIKRANDWRPPSKDRQRELF